MRILYSHYLSAQDHPAVRMVEKIAEQLRESGHEVLVHRSAGPPPAEKPSGSAAQGRPGWRSKVWFLKALARNLSMLKRDQAAIATFHPDVIVARQDAYCFSMKEAAYQNEIPLVTYADAPVAYESRIFGGENGRWHPPGLVEWIERSTIAASRSVITVSHPAARCLRRYQTKTPIHVISNGVTPSSFPELTHEEKSELRKSLGLKPGPVVGFAGTFKAFHGTELLGHLIRSTAYRRDTQWLLIGDGPELPALRDSVSDLNNVVILGRRPASEMGRLLNAVDIAVSPHPRMKGEFYFCPLKILEYGASGCATLASDQGDVANMLDFGRYGVLVGSGDPRAWEIALHGLLNDPNRVKVMGKEAREWVLNHYTWTHTAQAVERVLRLAVLQECASLSPLDPFAFRLQTVSAFETTTCPAYSPSDGGNWI